MAKIADISKYQGVVNWEKAASELDFVILRASCGKNKDARIAENIAGCTQHGIPFHCYHYLKALSFDEALSEAEVFFDAVSGSNVLFYVLDCEYPELTKLNNKNPGVARSIVEDFVSRLKELAGNSIRIGCYIGHHLYTGWKLDYSAFDYVWIPRYGKNSGQPETKPAYPCDIWQYTSNGKLDGVKGRVDLNMLEGNKPLSFFTTSKLDGTYHERSDAPVFTNIQFAQYCLAVFAAKWVYWYGTCGYKCTSSLFKSKKNQYPSHYTSSRESGYNADINAGKMCADCVGLIKSFFWLGGKLDGTNKYASNGCPDKSANGMFGLCKETGKIGTIPDIPGLVVWRDGHIGVYVGDGYTIEMKGFAYDCVKKKTTAGTWTHWGKLPPSMLSYGDGEVVIPTYKLGERTIESGDEGADVAELQTALVALGYDLGTYGSAKNGVDGDFGKKTTAAVKSLQEKAGLSETGVFDTATYKALLAAQNPAPDVDVEEPTDTPDGGSKPAYVLIIEGKEDALKIVQLAYGGTLAAVDSVVVSQG